MSETELEVARNRWLGSSEHRFFGQYGSLKRTMRFGSRDRIVNRDTGQRYDLTGQRVHELDGTRWSTLVQQISKLGYMITMQQTDLALGELDAIVGTLGDGCRLAIAENLAITEVVRRGGLKIPAQPIAQPIEPSASDDETVELQAFEKELDMALAGGI